MFTSLTTHLERVARIAAIPAVLMAGALALAQPAAAADYCVAPNSSCTGSNNLASLQGALDAAAAAPDSDRVFLGAGTYTAATPAGFVYDKADSPVELIGAGQTQTTLTSSALSPQNILRVIGGPGTSVHDLAINMPPAVATGADGLDTNGTAKQISLFEDPSQTHIRTGVLLDGGGTLEDSSLTLYSVPDSTGVLVMAGGGTIRHSNISARRAVQLEGEGLIQRSYLYGRREGVWVDNGHTTIAESMIRVPDANGIGISAAAQTMAGTTVDARNVTLYSPAGTPTGIAAATLPAQANVEINLTNSVIRGFAVPFDLYVFGSGTVKATASYSDYDSGASHTNGPNATISESHVSYAADPGFSNVASGNLRLMAGSPLIDAGDPATPQGLDMDGDPLVTDGNLDGTARRDIGAFERPGPLPVDPPPSGGGQPPAGGGDQPPSADTAQPATPATSTPEPVQPAARDTQAPLISGLRSSRKAFAVGRAKTAIAALARGTTLSYTLSEAAKVTVKIQRDHARRAAGKLTRNARKGVNTLKFSGRIGARALKPGRYTFVVTAVDAAGNRSAAKSVRFRVLAG